MASGIGLRFFAAFQLYGCRNYSQLYCMTVFPGKIKSNYLFWRLLIQRVVPGGAWNFILKTIYWELERLHFCTENERRNKTMKMGTLPVGQKLGKNNLNEFSKLKLILFFLYILMNFLLANKNISAFISCPFIFQ